MAYIPNDSLQWTLNTHFNRNQIIFIDDCMVILLCLNTQKTRDINPMLFQCWPTSKQQRVNASCLLGLCLHYTFLLVLTGSGGNPSGGTSRLGGAARTPQSVSGAPPSYDDVMTNTELYTVTSTSMPDQEETDLPSYSEFLRKEFG